MPSDSARIVVLFIAKLIYPTTYQQSHRSMTAVGRKQSLIFPMNAHDRCPLSGEERTSIKQKMQQCEGLLPAKSISNRAGIF